MKRSVTGVLLGFSLVAAVVAGEGGDTRQRIDVHLHAYKVAGITRLIGKSVAGVPAVKSDDELIANTMLELDKNNVRWGIVSGNDELLSRWMKLHPNRLIRSWLPKLDEDVDHDAEAEELKARIASKEVRAIGELTLAYIRIPLNDRRMWPYYRVAEGKVPIFFHTGVGPNRDHGTFNNPQFLGEIATAFPKLVIVACHMADGQEDALIHEMKEHKNIYADISVMNWYPGLCKSTLRRLKDEGLLSRVLYGSDQMVYPGLISRSVKVVESSGLTDEELDAVFWKNAARIIDLPVDKPSRD